MIIASVSLVAALDQQRGIGRDNTLPWRLPDDLKRFKALTLGKAVLMGRKTAQSLGRALPERRNLVLTRTGQVPFPGMESVASLNDAFEQVGSEELMVIGGGQLYQQTLPLASRLYLTHVATTVTGADAFFPEITLAEWDVLARDQHDSDARHAFSFEFVNYRRKHD